MKNSVGHSVLISVLVWIGVVLFLISGCSTLKGKDEGNASTDTVAAAPAVTAQEAGPIYLDFGDVMLPRELKADKKESFVMNTAGMTSGVLVMSGGVDANSLVSFFESKMPVDGWSKVGSFRSARSLLLFEKATRWCAIAITDGQFSTKVEIWVAPTTNVTQNGLHK